MIFACKQIQEKCIEQHRDLYMLFIDLTKAFDTVSREHLWIVLRKFGCPNKLVNIIQQLHDGMMGRVILDGGATDPFPISNGVKRGCVLAPTLFGLYLAAVLQEATKDLPLGISIRFRSGQLFKLSRLRAVWLRTRTKTCR